MYKSNCYNYRNCNNTLPCYRRKHEPWLFSWSRFINLRRRPCFCSNWKYQQIAITKCSSSNELYTNDTYYNKDCGNMKTDPNTKSFSSISYNNTYPTQCLEKDIPYSDDFKPLNYCHTRSQQIQCSLPNIPESSRVKIDKIYLDRVDTLRCPRCQCVFETTNGDSAVYVEEPTLSYETLPEPRRRCRRESISPQTRVTFLEKLTRSSTERIVKESRVPDDREKRPMEQIKKSKRSTKHQSEIHRRSSLTTVEEQETSYRSERSNDSKTTLNKTYTKPEEAYQPEYYDERDDISTNSIRSSSSSSHQDINSKIHTDDVYTEDIDETYSEDIDETYSEDIDETYSEHIDETYSADIDETYSEDIDETYSEDIDETYPDEIPKKPERCSRRKYYDTINKKNEIDYQQWSDGLNSNRQNTDHTRCYSKSEGSSLKDCTCRTKSSNTSNEYKSFSCTSSKSRPSTAKTPPPLNCPTKRPCSPGGRPLPCRSSATQCAPPPIPLSLCTPPHSPCPPERPPSCERKSLKRISPCEEKKSTKEKCPSRKRNPNVEKCPQPTPQTRCCPKCCPAKKHDLKPLKKDPSSRCPSRGSEKSGCSSKSSKRKQEVSCDPPKYCDREKCPSQIKKVKQCDDRKAYKPCSTTKENKPKPKLPQHPPKCRKSEVRTDYNTKCDTSHDNSPCQICEYCLFIREINKKSNILKSAARAACIDKKTELSKACRCCQDGKTTCTCCYYCMCKNVPRVAQKTKIPVMVKSPCIDISSKPEKVKISCNNACTCNVAHCKCNDRKPVIVDKLISCTSIGSIQSLNSTQCLRRTSAKSILPSKSFTIKKQKEIERAKRKKIRERNKPAEPNIKLVTPVIPLAKNIKQQSVSRLSSTSSETTRKQYLKKAIETVPSNMYPDVPDLQFIGKSPGKKMKIIKIKKLNTTSRRKK